MTGFWLSLNTVTAILPEVLKDTVGLSDTNASLALMIAALANAVGYLTVGHLAQRYGRRPFLIAWGSAPPSSVRSSTGCCCTSSRPRSPP